jgi:putative flippase GtrA
MPETTSNTTFTKPSARKIKRYLVSGVASELIEYGSFVFLFGATHLLVLSNSISFGLGIASGFVFHKFWSFAGSQQLKTHRQIVGYSLLAAGNFVVTNIGIDLLVHGVRLRPLIAKLVTMAVTAAWSFVAFNKLIFRQTGRNDP